MTEIRVIARLAAVLMLGIVLGGCSVLGPFLGFDAARTDLVGVGDAAPDASSASHATPAKVVRAKALRASDYPAVRPLQIGGTVVPPFETAYQGGKGHLGIGRVGLALIAFEKALAIDPLSVAALNAIGTAYDELHRYDLAQAYYKRALTLEPTGADTLNNMAVSLRLAGNADAGAWFERAAALDPGNEIIQANLAQLQADRLPASEQRKLADVLQAAEDDLVGDTKPRIMRSGRAEYELKIPLHPVDAGRVLASVPARLMPAPATRIEVETLATSGAPSRTL